MADNINITQGTGTAIATDDAGSAGHVQIVKLGVSTDGSASPVPSSLDRGLEVDPRTKAVRLSVTPTISAASVYAAADCIGGIMTFSNAARVSGGAIRIESLNMVDKDSELADMELLLFDRDPTTAGTTTITDNVPFDPVDADLAWVVGSFPISWGHYSVYTDNSVACVDNIGIEAVLSGTNLFGVLIARDTPTYSSTSDLIVTLTIRQF